MGNHSSKDKAIVINNQEIHQIPRVQPLPWELPEIFSHISLFLDRHTLTICLRVSHTWHESFLPSVWSSLHISALKRPSRSPGATEGDFETCNPSPEALHAHALLVHRIQFWGEHFGPVTEHLNTLLFPNLIEVDLQQLAGPSDWTHFSYVDFIRSHQRSLQSFVMPILPALDIFLERILASGCPDLQELRLGNMRLMNDKQTSDAIPTWLRLYDGLWSRLRVLSLKGYWSLDREQEEANLAEQIALSPGMPLWASSASYIIESLSNHPVSAASMAMAAGSATVADPTTTTKATGTRIGAKCAPAKIQELSMDGHDADGKALEAQLWVIEQCPDLRRLRWTALNHLTLPMHLLARAIQEPVNGNDANPHARQSKWPKLESIGFKYFENKDLEIILDNLSSTLRELDLQQSTFNLDSWEVLKNAANGALLRQLSVLNLHRCSRVPGSALHEMMCLMPNLQDFRTESRIQDTDLLQDEQRSWVCFGLKHLEATFAIDIYYAGGSRPQHARRLTSQPMILSRLSQLEKLEHLQLRTESPFNEGELWLSLRQDDHTGGEGGLDLLKTLKKLRVFIGPSAGNVSWGHEEDSWVQANWPRLETISGIELRKDAKFLKEKNRVFRVWD
ncbi:hypothetical protein BGZ83_000533 [Gryganskiella cystojenkinii]|nr:hypothetical protein BGZ83_000533 [Gryganskiella cystojenkinii]